MILYSGEIQDTGLDLYDCGVQKCPAGYSVGPSLRDFYILHFILDGKGTYTVGLKTYYLSKGDVFFICPDTLVHYEADSLQPWTYAWVGFSGREAEYYVQQCGLSVSSPVLSDLPLRFVSEVFGRMFAAKSMSRGRSAYLKGYLLILLSKLIERAEDGAIGLYTNDQEAYVKRAEKFIQVNYNRKMDIKAISDFVGIDSKYLWRLFKRYKDKSPSEFLIETRLCKACLLLKNTAYSISDISRSVGYENPLQFSKIFKKYRGASPKKYRGEYGHIQAEREIRP